MSGSLRHDDAGRVDAPLALQALQAERGLDDLLGLRVLVVDAAELGRLVVARVVLVEHAGQRHVLAHDGGGIALVSFSPIA